MEPAARVAFLIGSILLLPFLLASCGSVTESQPLSGRPRGQTADLRIRVLDAGDRSPLPGAKVVLADPDGRVAESFVPADIDGMAWFPILPPGDHYIVRVTMPGYGAVRIQDLRLEFGETRTVVVVLHEEPPDPLFRPRPSAPRILVARRTCSSAASPSMTDPAPTLAARG